MTLEDQLLADLAYSIKVIGCNEEEANELIQAADNTGCNVEYFCEEFIFGGQDVMKYHDDDYLDIEGFNSYSIMTMPSIIL